MKFEGFSFGSIQIDGRTYNDDIVIEAGTIRKRDKTPSRKYRDQFAHTPLSAEEDIPWSGCKRLVIGTGTEGKLPVLPEIRKEAERRKIELLVVPTGRAIEELDRMPKGKEATNAVLHITC